MKRKTKLALLLACVAASVVIIFFVRNRTGKDTTTPGAAIITAQYTDDQGNKLNVYICKMVYLEGEIQEQTALDLAYHEIIDPTTAEEISARTVYGVTAMLYKKDGYGYLCWATSEEFSTVIEYVLDAVTEEEVFLMMKSALHH